MSGPTHYFQQFFSQFFLVVFIDAGIVVPEGYFRYLVWIAGWVMYQERDVNYKK